MSAAATQTRRDPRPLRDFALAVTTLTAVPLRAEWPSGERTDAPGYYPLVGALLGGVAYLAIRLLELAGWRGGAPLVVAALLVAVWSLLTRMLHWDGLGDVADGFWAHEAPRRLEIMSDSAVGAFAVTAIALGVVAEVASVGSLLQQDRWVVLAAIPVFARAAATFGAWLGKAAKPDGLGASVVGRPSAGAVIPAAVILAATAALLWQAWGADGLWFSLVAVTLALGVPHVVSSRFGGVTGDVLGASVVIVEALSLSVAALWR